MSSISRVNITDVRRMQRLFVDDLAFPVAAARTWNSLPHHVTLASSVPVFRARLKTNHFSLSFYDCKVPRSDHSYVGHEECVPGHVTSLNFW